MCSVLQEQTIILCLSTPQNEEEEITLKKVGKGNRIEFNMVSCETMFPMWDHGEHGNISATFCRS